jgi:thioesterase domain-containing protein
VAAGALVAYTAEQAEAKRTRPTLVHQWSNETFAWIDPRSEAEREQELADNARSQRDRLLAASDWIAIRAVERGEAMPEDWQTYRQALRDVPEQQGFPAVIDWPTAPA